MLTTLALFPLLLAPQREAAAEPAPAWTRWGGPTADFVVAGAPQLVEDWGEAGPKVLWKRELGPGYASMSWKTGRRAVSIAR